MRMMGKWDKIMAGRECVQDRTKYLLSEIIKWPEICPGFNILKSLSDLIIQQNTVSMRNTILGKPCKTPVTNPTLRSRKCPRKLVEYALPPFKRNDSVLCVWIRRGWGYPLEHYPFLAIESSQEKDVHNFSFNSLNLWCFNLLYVVWTLQNCAVVIGFRLVDFLWMLPFNAVRLMPF